MTAPQTTPDVSSAPTLGDEVGEFFGDYTHSSGETPDPDPTSAAGTTPAEPATGPDTETPEAPVVAAASDGTTPDTPTADVDPFAETTPATFTVNGKTITNEGIRVFKEGGGVITPDALPDVLNKLSERESLFERNRAQSTEYQTLSKVMEWTDPSSNTTYTGPEAAIQMRIGNAALLGENQLLVDHLTDPDKLWSLLTTEMVPDGKGGTRERVIIKPTALRSLQIENENRSLKSASLIREHYKGVIAESSKGQAAPIDYPATATALVGQIATASKLDASVLTPADKAMLAKQLPFHTKEGLASLEWQELVKDRIAERIAQKANTQSVVSATEKATKEGQARMAAAARGVKPKQAPTTAPTVRPPSPTQERQQNEGDAWDIAERAAANAMRQRA